MVAVVFASAFGTTVGDVVGGFAAAFGFAFDWSWAAGLWRKLMRNVATLPLKTYISHLGIRMR